LTKEKKKGDSVKDLVKKVEQGKLIPKEAKAEVLKIGLCHKKYEYKCLQITPPCMIAGCFLCFPPFIANQIRMRALSFLARLSSIDFPLSVKITVSAFFIILFAAGMYVLHLRTTWKAS
jgi:hypothetical protein